MDLPSISSITSKIDTTLTDTMSSITSGAAFSKASSALGDMKSLTAGLPDSVAASIAATQANLQATINASVSTLSRDVGVAKTAMDLQNKLAFASTGFPATPEALAAAAGPLGVLANGPAAMADTVAKLKASISSISLPSITDPGYASALSNLHDSVKGHLTAGEDVLKAHAADAATALTSGITAIKALSMLGVLTGPAPALVALAMSKVVDYAKVPTDKVTAALGKAAPSIPTVVPGI